MSPSSNTHEKKILVIDDDPMILDIYSRKFQDEQIPVRCVHEDEATVEYILRYNPTLILLDIAMPHRDGLTVLKELKEDSRTKAIKIVLLTNNADKDDVVRGLSLGAEDYILKVIHTPSEVVKKIKKLLETA